MADGVEASEEQAQRRVIAFLADSATHGGAAVEQVETHISMLFLAGDRVYKLKKALTFPFLDFSSVEKREAACRRELEVNAIAGDLYRSVQPIIQRRDGGLALGGAPGEGDVVVDWVVEMRRFDRAQEFDKLLETGQLDRRVMERLGDRIAEMHRAAEIRRSPRGRAAVVETADNLAKALEDDAWRAAVEDELARVGRRLDSRARHGFMRRCHGDLHLANIVLLDGVPTPFDAIEFNERIATTDIAYDLAFPLMDLLSHGRADLANALVGRYLGATRDYGALALMPLFVSIRAAVRAMTAEMRGASAEHVAERRRLMAQALAPRPAPRLVVTAGLSGSGKSTIARAIAPALGPLFGAVVISSDVTRKRMFGATPETKLPSECYRHAANLRVYRRMRVDARRALRAGHSVILDAVHGEDASRAAAEELARSLGVRFDGVWLQVEKEARVERVRDRRGDSSDADTRVAQAQGGSAPRRPGWRVISAAAPPEDVAVRVRKALGAE